MGVDLPAYRAIIRDLRRYGSHGLEWIPVLEYLQFSGRAGRPKYDKEGQTIAIAGTTPEKKEIYNRYILGEPEEIYSKLAVEPVLRTYLLSLVATRFVRTKKELISFFEKTFWAQQFEDMQKLEAIIDKMLAVLEEWEFISSSSSEEFVSAAELGKNSTLTATVLGKRVAELYIDPFTAHQIITGMRKATVVATTAFSLLQLISTALEMKPLLRAKMKEYNEIQGKIIEYEGKLLVKEPSMFEAEYEDFMNSVKTALFFEEWINEMNEEYLLEKFGIRPGEIRAKLETANWLLYASAELSRLLQFRSLQKEITKLRFRVKAGAKEELLPLLRLKNIGRVRARKLYNNRIRDIGDVKKADVATLTQILGSGRLALDIKEQVGQKTEAVKKGKRKGQMSIERY
jgi:helicase